MSKDQAIAPIDFGQVPQQGDLTWPESALPEKKWTLVEPAPPDCRTCAKYRGSFCATEFEMLDCTNGDKYEPSERVVLWRTE